MGGLKEKENDSEVLVQKKYLCGRMWSIYMAIWSLINWTARQVYKHCPSHLFKFQNTNFAAGSHIRDIDYMSLFRILVVSNDKSPQF